MTRKFLSKALSREESILSWSSRGKWWVWIKRIWHQCLWKLVVGPPPTGLMRSLRIQTSLQPRQWKGSLEEASTSDMLSKDNGLMAVIRCVFLQNLSFLLNENISKRGETVWIKPTHTCWSEMVTILLKITRKQCRAHSRQSWKASR